MHLWDDPAVLVIKDYVTNDLQPNVQRSKPEIAQMFISNYTVEYYSTVKRELLIISWHEIEKHFAEQKKLDTKQCILYNSIQFILKPTKLTYNEAV